MSDFIIRAASATDMTAVQSIYAREVLEGSASFETDPPTIDDMSHRYQLLVEAGFPYLVAEVDGVVAGYGYAGPYRPRYAYRFSVENSVYIHPDFRRQGLAARLLNALIEICSEGEWQQMIAVIGDSNNVSSIRLHERCGFTPVGVLEKVGYKHNRWIDTVLMQRSLT